MSTRDQKKIEDFFPLTIASIVSLISNRDNGITAESLINIFVELNKEAEQINNDESIYLVRNKESFGYVLIDHLSTISRIIEKKKPFINDLESDIKTQVINTEKSIIELDRTLKPLKKEIPRLREIAISLKKMEDEKDILLSEKAELEKIINGTPEVIEGGLRKEVDSLKNEIIRLKDEKTKYEKEQLKLSDEHANLDQRIKNTQKNNNDLVNQRDKLVEKQREVLNLQQELESEIKNLNPDEIKEKLDKLLSEADYIISPWMAFISDSDVKECFNLHGTNTEDRLHCIYSQISEIIKGLEKLSYESKILYKDFLPQWEQRYTTKSVGV